MNKLFRRLCLVLLLVSFLPLSAGVNLKNGNYYVSYTDHKLGTSKAPLKSIVRTYNSKSVGVGLFGYGWGSDIETRLKAYPDGFIIVQENGLGGSTYFVPLISDESLKEFMIDMIVDTAIEQGDLKNNPSAILQYRESMADWEKRASKWDLYVKKGLLEYETSFIEDMEWHSNQRGNQVIKFNGSTFLRKANKADDTFNLNGQLTRIDYGNGIYSVIEYENSRIRKISNSEGSVYTLETNSDGLIIKIISPDGESSYKYSGNDLIETSDTLGNIYLHQYDTNHNMTQISYQDDSKYMIEYYPGTQFVKQTTSRTGEVTDYEYGKYFKEDGSVDKDHYSTSVYRTDEYTGEPYLSNYVEYIIGTRPSGKRYTAMVKTIRNGIETTTLYDDLCDNVKKITRGVRTTTFEYNNRCLMTRKDRGDGDVIELDYHPDFDKITRVTEYGITTTFNYDQKGNLIEADINTGEWLKLEYDDKSQILVMRQKDRTLNFEYNEYGKPVRIIMEGKGSIDVTYDSNGEIDKVNSESGHKMALEVTSAFQSMLAIVKPAGVDLGL